MYSLDRNVGSEKWCLVCLSVPETDTFDLFRLQISTK